MRKNYVLSSFIAACACVLSLPVNAAASLLLNTNNNQPQYVYIDDKEYQTYSAVNLFDGLQPGDHKLRVITKPAQNPGRPGGMPLFLYEGVINLAADRLTEAVIESLNSLRIERVITIIPVAPVVVTPPAPTPTPTPTPQVVIIQQPAPAPTPAPPVIIGMPDNDFAAVVQSVKAQRTESSRLAVAKQAVSSNRMNAAQVASLVKLMDFESSKLELAKHGYRNCADRGNYSTVSAALGYGSSVKSLADFIANYRD